MAHSDAESDGDSLPIMLHSDVDDYSDSTSDFEIIVVGDDKMDSPIEPQLRPQGQPQRPTINVPVHPIPQMQGPFAESMHEAAEASDVETPKAKAISTQARRKLLLDQPLDEATHAARWKKKPGQKHHQLWKLMAQVSFGIHLLLHGIAKDEQQVLAILQRHVDEIDEFLEQTIEDFDLAKKDIDERLRFLQLPLQNIQIFDAMLEDRNFRAQIVTGNERIEHIITRTATAMNDALIDVQHGLDSTREFADYLTREGDDKAWHKGSRDMHRVYDAMKGNTNGWQKAFLSLQAKGEALGIALVQLGTVVAEMDKRAGDVSRRTRSSVMSSQPLSPAQSPPTSPKVSKELRQSMSRSLPSNPSMITPAIKSALPAFQLVQDRTKTPDSPPETVHEEEEREEAQEPEPAPEPEMEEPPVLFLKPHTYSPMPSPAPSPTPSRARMIRQESRDNFVESSRESSSELRREPRRQQSQDMLRETKQQPSREVLREPRRQGSQDMLREPRRQASQDMLRQAEEKIRSPRKQVSQDMLRQAPEERLRESRRKLSQDLLRDSRRKLSQDMLREPRRQQSSDMLREVSRQPSGDTLRDSASVMTNDTHREVPRLVETARPSTRGTDKAVQIEIPRKSSMRERFSMRRQGTESGATITLPPRDPVLLNRQAERNPVYGERRAQGLDSAYYSDTDRAGSATPQTPSVGSSYFRPPTQHEFSPPVMTPRSDQQHFRPVIANPNSPLQRPWTATTAPLVTVPGRNLQSAMGMSMRSQQSVQSNLSQSTVVTQGGTRLKKKKSGFGWLKKAFSLSEEEKAAFEARRRAPVDNYHYDQRPVPRFLDGKRIA